MPRIQRPLNNSIHEDPLKFFNNISFDKSLKEDVMALNEGSPKTVIYSKTKHNINNNILYTISDEKEKPPEINELFKVWINIKNLVINLYRSK
jgi:hypothetical protein